ncbi:MAG: ABC transporter permease [Prolixibacteraceae bacterium]|nr:ABC transporter permease [Prolixibacteraceae bacterium]MBN2773453.1 ABC transporter permease [Prolixibacteraceae bacterium]
MAFKNLLVGWRNIRKNGLFSVINITGLSLGIAVVTLILFWVTDELSYNKSYKNIDRIYTVFEHQQYSEGQELFTYCTPFPLSQYLMDNFPDVKYATTFWINGEQRFKIGDKAFKEGPVVFAGEKFLDIFSYDVIEGDPEVLSKPDQIILTEKMANILFGDEPAIGKVIQVSDEISYSVGAIIASTDNNSTIDFEIAFPLDYMNKAYGSDFTRWGNNWPRTSVLLAEGTNIPDFEKSITNLCKDNGQDNTTLHTFPFEKERLYSYSGKNNRTQYVYQFLGIALIIILIASINFINLSTARAETRRPEVGIRKVMGAGKASLLSQFLQEKGIMIFLSILLSFILVLIFIPAFRSVSDKVITFGDLQNKYMIYMLITVVVTVLVLSVVYPSLYLSSFNPAQAIKRFIPRKGNISLKNVLVVFQFILAVVLISSTIVISRQIKYIHDYDLGYDQANLIYLNLNGEARNKYDAVKQEVSQIPGVVDLTLTNRLPFYGGNSSWGFEWDGKDPENDVLICTMYADKDYFKTMGMDMAAGNGFPESYNKVINIEELPNPQVVLNEEAIRRMKLKDPVGKYFGRSGEDVKGMIAGVVKDFHFQSLHVGVEPMLILPLLSNPDFIIIRVAPQNFSGTINEIKSTWAGLFPSTTCEVGFFDDSIESLYNSELKISGLFKYFSFIAIFISCIGLFGLSLFIIERRKKEIGVRKVNGAKIGEVMILLNKSFIKWVMIAFVLACPITWFIMQRWLENFAYKTNIGWWVFAFSGILAVSIAILTVSYQSWKAARANPTESLRYE